MAFQQQPALEDIVSTGSLSAAGNVLTLEIRNSSGALANVSGTWAGTIVFEGSNDGFVTSQNAAMFTPSAGVITAGVTTNGYYRFVAVSGFTQIRARMSAYTSGSAIVVLSASIGTGLAPTVSINYASMLGTSKLIGFDGATIADIDLIDGKRRLYTVAQVTVEAPVFTVPGNIGDLYIKNATNGASSDLRVNGTLETPIIFQIDAHATKSIFFNELSFYGGAYSIKFGQFIGQNIPLTNGVLVEIKSNNQVVQLPILKTTQDFKNKFSYGNGDNFRIDTQPSLDQFMAIFSPSFSTVLKKQGSFGAGNDDYIKVFIRDDLSTKLDEFQFIAKGFTKVE